MQFISSTDYNNYDTYYYISVFNSRYYKSVIIDFYF